MAEAVKGAQVVIEAVIENMDLKNKFTRNWISSAPKIRFLPRTPPGYPSTEIGSMTKRAEKVIGMHFFNPGGP